MKEYLPSKEFVIRIGMLILIVGVCFGIYKLVNYFLERSGYQAPKKILVKDLVQKDSNNNGIPDWEEYLWGLDPQKDGKENKAYIESKKSILTKENAPIEGEETLTENETLSREFFAIIVSLQESGNLTTSSIDQVVQAIGEKIVPEPIPNTYVSNMLVLIPDTQENIISYYSNFFSLVTKYADKNIGDELTFFSQGVINSDPQAIALTKKIAFSYKSFGEELIKIPVPYKLSSLSLEMANNYDKNGQSIEQLSKILEDPMSAMKGLINYKKYNDALLENFSDLPKAVQ